MSVDIDPIELSFRRPFTEEVQQLLKIKNPNSTPVAFKVKTTAPKQYCVRPNSGRIEPGQDVEVAVLLQAMKADPPKDAKCRDKFLVQSVNIPAAQEFTNLQEFLDNTDKRSMQEKKIRVNWLAADLSEPHDDGSISATPLRPTRSHEDDTTIDASRAFTSPNEDAPSSPPPYPEDSQPAEEEPSPVVSKPSPPSKAPPTYDELQARLASAEQIIESLRQELQLRKRKGGAEKEKSAPEPQQAAVTRQETAGVPVKIVAALCFLTFLLSYIFF